MIARGQGVYATTMRLAICASNRKFARRTAQKAQAMKLAYTMTQGRGDLDLLLYGLADAATRAGLRCAGVVQSNSDNGTCTRCDMDVKVLPNGPVIRISQSLGANSRGCRLDPAALENAVAAAMAHLEQQDADLLIVNKFGKHEAEGRGFRDPIAEAIARDIPVVVGVNPLNVEKLLAFTGPDAMALPPTPDALLEWVVSQTAQENVAD